MGFSYRIFEGLKWERLKPGLYIVESYTLRLRNGRGTLWLIDDPVGKRIGQRDSLVGAIGVVRDHLSGQLKTPQLDSTHMFVDRR